MGTPEYYADEAERLLRAADQFAMANDMVGVQVSISRAQVWATLAVAARHWANHNSYAEGL